MLARLGPYGLIAATCVVVNFVVMVGGERIGLHYVVSTSISFAVCVVLGYLLHSNFTFVAPISAAGFARYRVALSLNYPLSSASICFFNLFLALPMIIAAPAATIVLTLYNFTSSRWAITQRAMAK